MELAVSVARLSNPDRRYPSYDMGGQWNLMYIQK